MLETSEDNDTNASVDVSPVIPYLYRIENIENYVKSTYLSSKCKFLEGLQTDDNDDIDSIHDPDTVRQVCDNFIALLGESNSLEECCVMQTVVSLVYYLDNSVDTFFSRDALLDYAFNLTDTLNPIHIHLATKSIWQNIKVNGETKYVFNIIHLCDVIAVKSDFGKAIGMCLAWSILGEITESKTKMFRFREFSELPDMLKDVDDEMLELNDSLPIIYLLAKSVGFLVSHITSIDDDHVFRSVGYRRCFETPKSSVKKLLKWLESLSSTLSQLESRQSNPLRLRIIESLGYVTYKLSEDE